MLPVLDGMHVPFWFCQLRRNLYLSPERLGELQRRRLIAVVRHAYTHVPYYRDLFDRVGVTPGDVRFIDDLKALPITTKAALRAHPKPARVTPRGDGDDYVSATTSGTTGMPIQLWFSRQEHWMKTLSTIRAYMETGYRLTDRQAVVSKRRDETENRWWFQRWGLFRKYHVCVFDDLDVQLANLRGIRPQHVHGYSSSLRLLAQALIEKDITEVRPRVVCTGAEIIDQETRETIEKGFGAPVVDLYGAVEFGNIAWECPTGSGYHINSDLILVEFLVDGRPAQPGERAELVCTSLFGYTMPLIRYSLGDVATPLGGVCPCGRGFPLMGPVEGRLADLITLPNGHRMTPLTLAVTIEQISGIRQYQVIQEATTRLLVRIIPDAGFTSMTPAEVKACCHSVVAPNVQIRVEVARSLPLEPSGKFRVVKSAMQQNAHQ